MSYVLEIALALATLALPELGWALGPGRPYAVLALLLVPYALAWCARRALLSGRFRSGALLERLLLLSPVLLQALAIGQLGWTRTLERRGFGHASLEEWPGLGLLWALLPYGCYQLAAIDARARSLVFAPDESGSHRSFQLRLLLAACLPFFSCLAGASLVGRSPTWRVRLEEVGLLGGLVASALVLLFLHGMPLFLRYAWDTVPLERGWARTMLEQVARAAGFRYRELLVWRTGQQMSNAAIVGFSKRSRLVFFSDLLLQQLGPRELAAVFAHEMGHARRAHTVVFGAFALGFFMMAQQVANQSGVEGELFGVAVLVVTVALWYFGFGYLSRRFELEADLESLRVVGESAPLVRALELVTGAHAHQRSSWRHFSTHDRVAFLRRVEANPLVGIRLRQVLTRWRKVGFALFAVAALLTLRDLAGSWHEDWLVSDLRLGRFEQAAARAEESGIDTELARLALRAAGVPESARDQTSLWGAALAARNRGDLGEAREWLELARLRGARRLDALIDALAQGEDSTADLPAAWRDAVKELSDS